jgi:hypothetical protein
MPEKEIWKLLELLNEYEKETKNSEYSEWWGLLWWRPQYLRCDTVESELLIISKGYRFIQRLVENDKIDKKKLDEAERRPMYVTDDMFSLYKVDECVIMLLSISDTPIEDLISYLK